MKVACWLQSPSNRYWPILLQNLIHSLRILTRVQCHAGARTAGFPRFLRQRGIALSSRFGVNVLSFATEWANSGYSATATNRRLSSNQLGDEGDNPHRAPYLT